MIFFEFSLNSTVRKVTGFLSTKISRDPVKHISSIKAFYPQTDIAKHTLRKFEN